VQSPPITLALLINFERAHNKVKKNTSLLNIFNSNNIKMFVISGNPILVPFYQILCFIIGDFINDFHRF